MLALVPWPGIKPRPPALGTRSQPLDQQEAPAGPTLTSVLMLVFTRARAQVTGGLQQLPVSSHLSLPLLPGCPVPLPPRAPSPSAPSFLGWSGQHCPSSCCCYCCCSWPACCPPPKRTTAALRLTTLPGPSTPCCGTPTGHPRHRGSAWPAAPHHQSVDLVSNPWVTEHWSKGHQLWTPPSGLDLGELSQDPGQFGKTQLIGFGIFGNSSFLKSQALCEFWFVKPHY